MIPEASGKESTSCSGVLGDLGRRLGESFQTLYACALNS